MITLIVKGTPTAALAAARRRGIQAEVLGEFPLQSATHLTALTPTDNRVYEWFHEPDSRRNPSPLLWFSIGLTPIHPEYLEDLRAATRSRLA